MERNQLVTRSMDYLIGAPSVIRAAVPANRRKLAVVAASVHSDQIRMATRTAPGSDRSHALPGTMNSVPNVVRLSM